MMNSLLCMRNLGHGFSRGSSLVWRKEPSDLCALHAQALTRVNSLGAVTTFRPLQSHAPRLPPAVSHHGPLATSLHAPLLQSSTWTVVPAPCAARLHTSAPRPDGEDDRHQPLTQRQRLKLAIRDYGGTVVVFHVTISLASLGFFYLAVKSGLDVVGILRWLGLGESLAQSKVVTGGSTFVLAYAVHKVFAPARIATTLACTPFIVRALRSRGILRTPKPRDD